VNPPEAVFHVEGDLVTPTELARGPWSPHAQHGGPPSALLARYLERLDPGPATFTARLTVDLMRPIPLTPLRLVGRTIRPGKKVQLLEASLFADDVEVARATALRLRTTDLDLVGDAASIEVPPLPAPGAPEPLLIDAARGLGFWNAVEVSRARGLWTEPGPAAMWIRLVAPLVAGEAPSPLQRVMAAADFGNALGAAFDRTRFSCINPDLSVTLERLPVGEWIGLDSVTFAEPTGTGVAESVLHDERGRIGRAVATVLLEQF
jgi:hypothetical protein